MSGSLSAALFDFCMIAVLTILTWFFKKYAKSMLKAAVNNLVLQAEQLITGSGLGEMKKAWVVSQLEAAGIKATGIICDMIDSFVDVMNKEKSSLIVSAENRANDDIYPHAATKKRTS
ncbi:MAG: hypothetical protein Q8878_04735 [Bacillota bacterium]|nr:hypothetical protein [Bacillota bacterium]